MLSGIYTSVDRLLGLSRKASELEFSHMTCRTLVVFCLAVLLFRVADRRFLGRNAGYDVMLGVVLGSVLSRGINGDASFFPTLGASAVLVILHHVLSALAYRSHVCSVGFKGRPRTLVQDGQVDHDELRRCKITADDLDENLRIHGGVMGTDDVREARLERNGEISVVKATSSASSGRTPPFPTG
jgi:uncharacterized membrane protein YcaP (DUF421 family)